MLSLKRRPVGELNCHSVEESVGAYAGADAGAGAWRDSDRTVPCCWLLVPTVDPEEIGHSIPVELETRDLWM